MNNFDNPPKSPLTIVPGWGMGRGALTDLAATLNATFIDLPGYRGTPLVKDFHVAADRLAEQLEPGQTLIGWSLGGMLSLAAAARHADKVGRLVLIAGTASFVARDGWPHAMPPEQLAEFTNLVLADVETLLPRFVGNFNRGDQRAKAITRELLDLVDPLPPLEVLATGLGWLRDVDLRPLLPAVRCPVLIVQGAHDPLMPLAGAALLAEALPDARLEVMEHAAHTPFLSDGEDFLSRVRPFL